MEDVLDLLGGYDGFNEVNNSCQITNHSTIPTASLKAEETNCSLIFFKEVCDLLDKIEKTKTTQAKLSLIFTKDLKRRLGDGQSVYPLIRLLIPVNDSERQPYGLKQMVAARIYISALNIDHKSPHARALLNWKNASVVEEGIGSSHLSGDFSALVETAIETRKSKEPSNITIGEVHEILDSLANAVGEAAKGLIIKDKIYHRFSPREQKWLIRIIFKDLKIG